MALSGQLPKLKWSMDGIHQGILQGPEKLSKQTVPSWSLYKDSVYVNANGRIIIRLLSWRKP